MSISGLCYGTENKSLVVELLHMPKSCIWFVSGMIKKWVVECISCLFGFCSGAGKKMVS